MIMTAYQKVFRLASSNKNHLIRYGNHNKLKKDVSSLKKCLDKKYIKNKQCKKCKQ